MFQIDLHTKRIEHWYVPMLNKDNPPVFFIRTDKIEALSPKCVSSVAELFHNFAEFFDRGQLYSTFRGLLDFMAYQTVPVWVVFYDTEPFERVVESVIDHKEFPLSDALRSDLEKARADFPYIFNSLG